MRIPFIPLLAVSLMSFSVMPTQSVAAGIKLTTDVTEPANDHFGVDVATNGSLVAVAANNETVDENTTGSVHIFDTAGNRIRKIHATNTRKFGDAIAFDNNTILVGDSSSNVHDFNAGAVYVFDVNGNQQQILTASDGESFDKFGSAIDAYNGKAIIGASYKDGPDLHDSWFGAAYIFDTTTGNQLYSLRASDADKTDHFGNAVAISSNTAIVGAYSNNDNGAASGSAYLFDLATGNQISKITASDAAEGDWFGHAVAISEKYALVGAHNDDNGNGQKAGAVYVFDHNGNELQKLIASDGNFADNFGSSIAIAGDYALIGAYFDDNGFSTAHGSAYLFNLETGEELAKIIGNQDSSFFAETLDFAGDTLIIGSDVVGANGTAYLYNINTIPEPATALLFSLTAIPFLSRKRTRHNSLS